MKKLVLEDEDFQEDLIFFTMVILLYAFGIIEKSSFDTLSSLIIAGDAIKKLGKRK